MKFLGIIPARSGSQTIKNKNLKTFNNKPLIYWTIKAAKNSKFLNHFVLSTNCKKIASVGKKYGADVPFLRSNKLARSTTNMHDVIKDFIKKYDKVNNFDVVVLLQPTSPLRTSKDIDKGCKLFLKYKPDSLIGVNKLKHSKNPEDLYKIKNKFLTPTLKNKKIYLKQKKKVYFSTNGSLYFTKTNRLKKFIIGGKIIGMEMSDIKSIDIDYEYEFKLAELIMKNKFPN